MRRYSRGVVHWQHRVHIGYMMRCHCIGACARIWQLTWIWPEAPAVPCNRYSKENVDLAAALLTLACLGEGKDISWQHEPRLRALLGLHSMREAGRRAPSCPSCLPRGEVFSSFTWGLPSLARRTSNTSRPDQHGTRDPSFTSAVPWCITGSSTMGNNEAGEARGMMADQLLPCVPAPTATYRRM